MQQQKRLPEAGIPPHLVAAVGSRGISKPHCGTHPSKEEKKSLQHDRGYDDFEI